MSVFRRNARCYAELLLQILWLAQAGNKLSGEGLDGSKALKDVAAQCAFGPRIPGTKAHQACRDWIKSEITSLGLIPWEQPFDAKLALLGKTERAYNLWALPVSAGQLASTGGPLIILSAHWDTRPVADRDPPGERNKAPFLGANDGGSGVALALGVARALKGTAAASRLVLAFFDAEDSGVESSPESYCIGSIYAADHPPEWFHKVRLGINLDMVGGKELRLKREEHSQTSASEAIDRLWQVGMDLAPRIYQNASLGAITDDHLPFVRKGIPFIDLIGWGYPYWHRSGDVPERCDAEVMKALGGVLVEFVSRETNSSLR